MSAETNEKKRGMTVKEFFKSTAFKCIMVLLAIVLVCGILLTICNTLFYVSDAERAERDRQKLLQNIVSIYGSEADIETVDTSELETSYSNGSISSAYYVPADGNYIINSTGTGGFSGGTVTCWVVVEITDGTVSGIGNVTVSSNTSQSWIGKVPDEALEYFGENFESGGSFSVSDWGTGSNSLTGGATMSTTAIVNSVNTALEFVRTQLVREEITDPYADFAYKQYIDTVATKYEVSGSTVTYNIVTSGYGYAGAFTITVVVNDGVITDYEIVNNGSTSGFGQYMSEDVLDGSLFEGKDADGILTLLSSSSDGTFDVGDIDDSLETGSTYSNFVCVYAALFATQNYDIAVGGEA